MAASMVHVEYQPSDSGSEGDLEQSDKNESSAEDEQPKEKHGLADVMAKILHRNVPIHKQVILAKGQTDKEIRKRKLAAEDKLEDGKKENRVEDGKKEKTENTDISADVAGQEKKKLWENMGRVKPNILEREKERQLQRIATRGVVQLFNAVRKQQKTVEEEVQKADTDRKKEKVMEKITKDKFLGMLKGSSVSNVQLERDTKEKYEKGDEKQLNDNKEKEKKWSILRDDYMMGAKMKDWNKESSDDDDADDDPGDPEMSDSD